MSTGSTVQGQTRSTQCNGPEYSTATVDLSTSGFTQHSMSTTVQVDTYVEVFLTCYCKQIQLYRLVLVLSTVACATPSTCHSAAVQL
jgi:hypothetical protein